VPVFTLPEELPATSAELSELRTQAQRSINVIQARAEAGEELSKDDVEALRVLLDSVDQINAAAATAAAEEEAHRTDVADLLTRATAATTGPETEETEDDDADVAAEVEVKAPETVAAAVEVAPVNFAGVGTVDAPATPEGPGWEMVPGAPGYQAGRIGFAELARAIDSVGTGSRKARSSNAVARGSYFAQSFARLKRDVPLIGESHALVAAIEAATDERKLPGGSLTAAGGWCAPSEQLYDFCDVPNATDLLSLPEITINRGGVRWPVEPDLSGIFDSFQFFFTETELEAVGPDGQPTAVKECVDIPCADEFEELRLQVVGYCVEAGILMTQGWPELIQWFMQSLAQEHLRAISRRTILDVVNGSGTPLVVDPNSQVGATSSVLNSLALAATNLRLDKGLARTATIEGIAPSWLHEVLRADLAMMGGDGGRNVSDAEIGSWLSARNIALQFVGDWQTRGANQPGNLNTLAWPGAVDIVLYPAGTWFRAMSNVIELGVMYPKEQLQVNRYTRFFTEDAIAVGKRCNKSIVVRIPLCVSGGVGARKEITCQPAEVGPYLTPGVPAGPAVDVAPLAAEAPAKPTAK
jgi:hypothetical protein